MVRLVYICDALERILTVTWREFFCSDRSMVGAATELGVGGGSETTGAVASAAASTL